MNVDVQAFDRICRACLNETNKMKSLFTLLDNGHQLLDLLINTVNLEVTLEDTLPKQICGDCEDIILKSNEFKRRCIESDELLRSLTFSNDATDTKIDVKEIFELPKSVNFEDNLGHKDLANSLPITEESDNSQGTNANNSVKIEINVDDQNDFSNDNTLENFAVDCREDDKALQLFKCCCNEIFCTQGELKDHEKANKCKQYLKNECTYKNGKRKRNFTCKKCSLEFTEPSLLQEHQINHVKEEKSLCQCSICLRQFKSKKSLRRHIKRHEERDNIKYTCLKCKREFKYKSFLDSHVLSVHSNTELGFSCEVCNENFLTRQALDKHTQTHTKRKNVCPFCEKAFIMLCTLKDHMRIHTGEKPFLCSTCGKGFSQKTNLKQHIRRHLGVKPFKCDICAMGFVSKGELDAHFRKHSGAHPFTCDDCGNGFTTSSALVKHRRIHTGERPYACDLCPMRFAASGTLKNHRRTHTGERPFQCSHCEKSFVQRSDLITHIRCHTGERPFICPHCGQAFRKAAAMKVHVRMHIRDHGGVIPGNLLPNPLQQLNAV